MATDPGLLETRLSQLLSEIVEQQAENTRAWDDIDARYEKLVTINQRLLEIGPGNPTVDKVIATAEVVRGVPPARLGQLLDDACTLADALRGSLAHP